MLDLLKVTQNPPSPSFNVVSSLEKLCEAVVARNEQAHLQLTLNKGAGGASLTIFVADCRLFTTKNSKKKRKVGKGILWPQFSLKK